MKTATDKLQICQMPCYAHTLQLVVHDVLFKKSQRVENDEHEVEENIYEWIITVLS